METVQSEEMEEWQEEATSVEQRLAEYSLLRALTERRSRRFGKGMRRTSRRIQERMADLASLVAEVVRGHRVVKAFGMEPFEYRRFQEASRKHLKTNLRAQMLANASSPVMPSNQNYVRAQPVKAFLCPSAATAGDGNWPGRTDWAIGHYGFNYLAFGSPAVSGAAVWDRGLTVAGPPEVFRHGHTRRAHPPGRAGGRGRRAL